MPGENDKRCGAALLVGVGDYLCADRVESLRDAARDAEALGDVLVDPRICGFPADRVKVLTDAHASRDDLVHQLSKWLPAQAKGAEIVLIYFAGHGAVQCIGQREEGYLLPHDADPDDLIIRGVAMADLARWIEGLEAKAVVLCLDCCHAARVVTPLGASRGAETRDMRIRPALLQGLSGRHRFLIAACDAGQASMEAESYGHGLFTFHLMEGLRGAGDADGDGKVGVAELFEYVAAAVETDARNLGVEQRPWISMMGPGGTYLSAPRPDGPPTEQVPSFERVDKTDVALAAIHEIEAELGSAGADVIMARLEVLRRLREPVGIPAICSCLVHDSAAVRDQAKKALRALGWEKTSAAIIDVARAGDVSKTRQILDGLAAFESHRDVVSLLDRLIVLLKGELRNRAILMIERKKLVLEMEKTIEVFRAIQSPYRISRVLGQGLYTSAYAARDEENELDVVVRVLRPEFAGQPQLRSQFLDVSRRSFRFVHQNLVSTRDVRAFPEHGLYYSVRDHAVGLPLQALIDDGAPFTTAKILSVLRQVASALTPIHEAGAAHLGIKPSNLFLGDGDRLVLGDPALPVPFAGPPLDRLSYDYRYTAPEVFRGGSPGPRADFYALGCIAYELACGRPPFVADNPFELAGLHIHEQVCPPSTRQNSLGIGADPLLLKLLAKAQEERFATIDCLLRALDDYQAARDSGDSQSRDMILTKPRIEEPRLNLEQPVSLVSFNPNTLAQSMSEPGAALVGCLSSKPRTLGRYVLMTPLGRGGMGTVYRARDEKLNRDIALKVVTVAARSRGEASHRFLREAQSIAMLDHPNIVHIYDIGEQDGFLFLAMELVEGGNLAQRIERDGAMSFSDAARIVLQLARAVDGAHLAGIIHRDLKPGNILLDTAGDPRITDFGLAKWQGEMAEDEEAITRAGVMLGTPGYMAPEQIRGDPDAIGPATDVYALGTILYECMTGRRPFQDVKAWSALYQIVEKPPQPPSAIRPEVPAPLDQICLKCLEKNPRKRYSSAELLAQALERWLDGGDDNAPAASRLMAIKPLSLVPAVKPVPVSLWTLLRRWFSGAAKS